MIAGISLIMNLAASLGTKDPGGKNLGGNLLLNGTQGVLHRCDPSGKTTMTSFTDTGQKQQEHTDGCFAGCPVMNGPDN